MWNFRQLFWHRLRRPPDPLRVVGSNLIAEVSLEKLQEARQFVERARAKDVPRPTSADTDEADESFKMVRKRKKLLMNALIGEMTMIELLHELEWSAIWQELQKQYGEKNVEMSAQKITEAMQALSRKESIVPVGTDAAKSGGKKREVQDGAREG